MVDCVRSAASEFDADVYRLAVDKDLQAGAERLASDRLKRAIDILFAFLALVLLSPLLVIVAVIIPLDTAGSPVFRQRRTGRGGRVFVIYKFRSMHVCEDGDSVRQARKRDVRITAFGGFIRRTSIDELPQLFNILKGDMSLAGPRPHAVAHDAFYGAIVPQYAHRFLAKPGLTGLAQVSGFRGPTETINAMAARVEADLEYIRRWSLWLDAQILLRTAVIFMFQPEAF